MSYETKHQLRAAVLALARKLDPKIKINSEDYDILVQFRRKSWSYLDILDLASRVTKGVLALPGVAPDVTDKDEVSLQFAGPGVELVVLVGREGVDLFLCENSSRD